MLEYMDDVLGRLFDFMEHSKLRDNTYVLVMGDNGAELFPEERKGMHRQVRVGRGGREGGRGRGEGGLGQEGKAGRVSAGLTLSHAAIASGETWKAVRMGPGGTHSSTDPQTVVTAQHTTPH